MTYSSIGVISWSSLVMRRRWRSRRLLGPCALRRFCCSWLALSPFSPTNVHMIWLTALQDLDTVHEWSWGGMTLAFLYFQLSLTTDLKINNVGGYMTLLEVIFFSSFLQHIVNDLRYYCVYICIYICLYDTCADIIVSLCVCRDGF